MCTNLGKMWQCRGWVFGNLEVGDKKKKLSGQLLLDNFFFVLVVLLFYSQFLFQVFGQCIFVDHN